MTILDNFSSKDMIEQITLLDEIQGAKQVEAIDALIDLLATPLGDQAVDEMIYHCLFDLLAGEEEAIIAGLLHDSEDVQLICVRRAIDGGSEKLKQALCDLLSRTANGEIIGALVQSLVHFKDPNLVDILLPYLSYEDCSVVAWAMQGLTEMKLPQVRDALINIVKASTEVKEESVGCELPTAMAVENLARFHEPEIIDFLVGYIHHPNPSFRRVIISTLAEAGADVLPALDRCLGSGDKDEKIMAANIIGMSGQKKGADLLVAQLEKAGDSNLKFAIYEALGRIPSMRSVVCLIDGLSEEEELVLMAVITALDQQCNPGVIKKINAILEKKDAQSTLVLEAIIASHAQGLFAALYKNGEQRQSLLQAIGDSGDAEAAKIFCEVLEGMADEQASKDAQQLLLTEGKAGDKRVLAADDSKAMLFFYKAVATDLGIELITVEDGRQALDHLEFDSDFELIITDMNMPNMDGIELTSEVRKHADLLNVPILMATTESESSQSELARQAGVTDFITKPFSKDEFKAKMSQMFLASTP